ncbi:hypothetical protein [Stutzerimonas stutzeri]|uniref:hypothetical protein n=1 Tax=Stutzerimonas stutzeri TaxID=316 RepID=UPI002446BE17|nr:hypothetical protein [Stutzerimonas stutzeri]MDH0156507.1 hypothetical protein [Stutzerimonas stutzeri]
MAGDWIKFELITLDKPEVCQIADAADIDCDAVVGKLLRVWGWFDQQTADGNAPSVSKRLLDRMVGVTGFCEHMKSVGWMVEADGTISLPNFDRHNGKTAKNRLLTAKRVAAHKAANGKGNAKGNAANVSDALPKEDVEKSKSNTPLSPPAGGGAQDDSPDQGEQPEPKPATKAKRGTRFPDTFLLTTDMARWARDRAPGVNLSLATEKFVNYWRGNGKTKVDWVAAWRNWVLEEQDRANSRRGAPAAEPDFESTEWAKDLGEL